MGKVVLNGNATVGNTAALTGRVFYQDYNTFATPWAETLRVLKDADGLLYTIGTGEFGDSGRGTITATNDTCWIIRRYLANGQIDKSYGCDGVVRIRIPGYNFEEPTGQLDANGKIIIGGQIYSGIDGTRKLAVARVLTDGQLDGTFNPNDTPGYLVIPLGDGGSYFSQTDLALQSDGKIILMDAHQREAGGVRFDFRLHRINTDGTPDLPYGGFNAGWNNWVYDLDQRSDDRPVQILIQSDDKVLIIGYTHLLNSSPNHYYWLLIRTTANGLADPTWGGQGFESNCAVLDFPAGLLAQAQAAFQQSDGKIVVGGNANTDASHAAFGIGRWNANGTLDASFGSSSGYTLVGTGSLSLGFESSGAMVALPSGGFLILGQTGDATGSFINPTTKFIVAAYNSNGTVNTSVGTSGFARPVPQGDNGLDSVFYGGGHGVVVYDDGSVICGGHVNSDTRSVSSMVKLNADLTINTAWGDYSNATIPSTPPTATTSAASSITSTTATLNGAVNPQGDVTDYQFEWGLDTAYGHRGPLPAVLVGSDSSSHAVSTNITGLTSGKTYHFRLIATKGSGVAVYTADATFVTP